MLLWLCSFQEVATNPLHYIQFAENELSHLTLWVRFHLLDKRPPTPTPHTLSQHTYMHIHYWGLGPWTLADRWLCSESQYAGRESGMRWGALIIIMLSAARWRSAFFFFFFLLCSRVGRHIPLALLSGPFPAAGGFCPPLPHCPSFLCSLAPTMAFFLPLNIYVHFLPLCVLFVLFCCLLCFSFPLLPSWEIAHAHTHAQA